MERKSVTKTRSGRGGFTLIESILSLFVVSTMVALLVGLATTRDINRRSADRSQAAALADEEINALRRLNYVLLTDQTSCGTPSNCPPKNILYNAGGWSVQAEGTAPSSPNALALAKSSGFTGSQSGQLLFPAGTYGDGTFTAKFMVAADSTSNDNPTLGWSIGYVLRSRDAANGYRLRLAENDASGATTDLDGFVAGVQNVYLEKISDGTATRLDSANVTLVKGAWYTLEATVTGASTVSLTVKVNAATLITASDAASPFFLGPTALIGWNGVHAFVDDIQVGASTWNFDAGTELPLEWVRLGLNDLPDTTPAVFNDNATVQIEPYPQAGSLDLKKATVTVRWFRAGVIQSYSTSTLIGKSGLGL